MKRDPINYDNHIGYRIKLNPTKEQKEILDKYFGIRRFVYNLGIDILKDNPKLSYYDLRKIITELKKTRYTWLSEYDSESINLALNDVLNAFKFYKNDSMVNKFPVYKSKKKSKKQFAIRSERLTILNNHAWISSIGWIKCYCYDDILEGTGNKDKSIMNYLHFADARIRCINDEYYLSFILPKDQTHSINSSQYYIKNNKWINKKESDSIGIDFGLRRDKWIVDSTNHTVVRPDNSKEYKKIALLNKKLNRQYRININRESRLFKDRKSPKNGQSKNIQKTKDKIKKYYKKITNRRQNTVYNYCSRLLDLKPKAVVMESIFVKDLQQHTFTDCITHKNRLNNLIRDASIYDSTKIIERKMMSNGIPVIYADDQYPSSQICSKCGHRHKIGRDEIYKCPNCGLVINRDYNAALNLANLANLKCPVKRLS